MALPSRHYARGVADASGAIDVYAERASAPEPPLLTELREATVKAYPTSYRMLSGHLQGRLLKTLALMAGAKTVLELGTFTGYSALCFAEALPADGRVVTLDMDERAQGIAKDFFRRSDVGHKIEPRLGSALDTLKQLKAEGRQFDLVFLDANKDGYIPYYEEVLGDATGPSLLAPKGFILADNVLFQGLVLAHAPDLAAYAPNSTNIPPGAVAAGEYIHRFNEHVKADPRTETVLVPLRDGLSIIRRV
eukprot:EG_transcript_18986